MLLTTRPSTTVTHGDDDRVDQEPRDRDPVEDAGVVVQRDVADRQERLDEPRSAKICSSGLKRGHEHEHQRQGEDERRARSAGPVADDPRGRCRRRRSVCRRSALGDVGRRRAWVVGAVIGQSFSRVR